MTNYFANDSYGATLRTTWIASPADTTLAVTAIPTNVPTIITVGYGTDYETLFSVTGTSGTDSSNYSLTGVTRLRGANVNIPANTACNCLNHEEFFNQYSSGYVTVADAQTITGQKTFSADIRLATGGNIQVNSADPYRTIVIPAGAMSPTTTAGCAALATVEAGTNDVDYKVLDFDTTTVESAFTLFQMPNNWDGGTITFKPVWTAASGSGTVCFGLKGRAFADDDAIDQAYGTEQTSTDTLITAGDVHIGPESSAITLAGTPAGGQLVQLKVTRQTGSDTLGVDARLIGIRILYKIAQYSD